MEADIHYHIADGQVTTFSLASFVEMGVDFHDRIFALFGKTNHVGNESNEPTISPTRLLVVSQFNDLCDIALRTGALSAWRNQSNYAVPVTTNWDADTDERYCFKAVCSKVEGVIYCGVPAIDRSHSLQMLIDAAFRHLGFTPPRALHALYNSNSNEFSLNEFANSCGPTLDLFHDSNFFSTVPSKLTPVSNDECIIVHTSGTTGLPKGGVLSHQNLSIGAAMLSDQVSLLSEVNEEDGIVDCFNIALINPLHHVNSSTVLFWALNLAMGYIKYPHQKLAGFHIYQRYSSKFFTDLSVSVQSDPLSIVPKCRWILPMTPKHVSHLSTATADVRSTIGSCIRRGLLDILVGSAEVDEKTFTRLRELQTLDGSHCALRTVMVRFGATETALQCVYLPRHLTRDPDIWQYGFDRGLHLIGILPQHSTHLPVHMKYWEHGASAVPEVSLSDSLTGETIKEDDISGSVLTRGPNIIHTYTNANLSVNDDGWYSGLGDEVVIHKGFVYWKSRSMSIVKRGGVKYTTKELEMALEPLIENSPSSSYAVIGIHLGLDIYSSLMASSERCSENLTILSDNKFDVHGGDTFIVLLTNRVPDMKSSVIDKSNNRGVKPGPDMVIFTREVPRTFKGSVDYPKCKELIDREIKKHISGL
eukprot:GHVH01016602.1.p1 GENE.GHVH01016602.1~~GHVH01016602.1.p1  ORF type:complete len:646 (+),score=80.05 GHVH01016602.1:1183-3120(+)